MKNVLGLIPARGGSKSIPQKNIAPLAGRPLLAYTCDAALGARHLSRVVVSTDDEQIAQVGRACGIEVPFLRPTEISQDTTPSIEVALHAVQWLADHAGWLAEVVMLLQPTSPFRRVQHIDESLELMDQSGADSVVSVIEVPHRYSPYTVMRLDGTWLSDFWQEPVPFNRFRRQEVPVLYARNGPVVLATRVPVMVARRSFYGERVAAYRMSERDSVDIDTTDDLRYAEWLLTQQGRPI